MPLQRIAPSDFVFSNEIVTNNCWKNVDGTFINDDEDSPPFGTDSFSNGGINISNRYLGQPHNLQFSVAEVSAGESEDENDCDEYNRLYEYEKSEIVFCAIKFSPRLNNNGSRLVSEIKVSLNVEAESLDEVSMSAAAKRVVPLTIDKDLISLTFTSCFFFLGILF